MPTETHSTPDYAAAWASIKLEAENATIETTGDRACSDAEIALIEPGIRILELSAAYRAAHAAYNEALAAAEEAFAKGSRSWHRLADEQKTAESAMEAAKQALLSAALDST